MPDQHGRHVDELVGGAVGQRLDDELRVREDDEEHRAGLHAAVEALLVLQPYHHALVDGGRRRGILPIRFKPPSSTSQWMTPPMKFIHVAHRCRAMDVKIPIYGGGGHGGPSVLCV